jgi:capsular exopolysaccharide synthesis family protein
MNAQPPVTPSVKLDLDVLVALSRPSEGSAEAIRALRTHIMAQHVEAGHRALAICTASSGVGGTYVAANLAVALSQIGVNTLLIDGNMREPTLDNIFKLPAPREGLQQCLSMPDTGYAEYGGYIEADILPNLSVMFAGGPTTHAQELLASERFKHLMDACLRDFDATIIDTPPANVCSDVSRIANVVSYGLVVARSNKSYINDVKLLADQLKAGKTQVIGTVLNDA